MYYLFTSHSLRRVYSSWDDYPNTFFTENGFMAGGTGSVTSSGSSGKRKLALAPKFYAVKAGQVPGIYSTWDEAKRQTDGVAGSIYQSFSTLIEAEAFMKGTGSYAKPGKSKYYAVAVGHVPGVYTDYTAVQTQTKGCKGAEHKSFPTRAEAQAYVDERTRGKSAPVSLQGHLSGSEASSVVTAKMDRSGESTSKRRKKENTSPELARTNGDIKFEPGMGPLPPGAEDGFDRTLKLGKDGQIRTKTADELSATKRQATGDSRGTIVVSTDGASRGNGRVGARAGVGVYFGPADSRNVSEPLKGERQTNQRAELVAIARALDHVPIDRDVEIRTDSMYSKKCLQEWFHNWEKNHWRNSAGRQVENKDLIQPVLARIRERQRCKAKTMITWVKGHAIDEGNIAADALANGGSDTWTVELASGDAREMSETLRTEYTNPRYKGTTPSIIKKEQKPSVVGGDHYVDEDGEDPFEEIFAKLAAEGADNTGDTGPARPSSIDGERTMQMVKDAASNFVDNGTPQPSIDGTEATVVVTPKRPRPDAKAEV
ncbi:ribonuclease h [Pyrenophora seminiperda CCB06]|uniref:ribonuclease H n=1 Tax=Pyrenophora seminiperda CCB06 TaxID=1302712 RepID=A0A3M7LYR2_9PLEO|nr:ribonuclease h [Pyrenophora seminiperda CCB06]